MTTVKFPILTTYQKRLADTITPVSIYLQIRDRFANPILLESSDYHGHENSYSYICFNPLATFAFNAGKVVESLPSGQKETYQVSSEQKLMQCLRAFGEKFDVAPDKFKFSSNGLFGYIQYDTVAYFEDIKLQNTSPTEVPMMQYSVYQNVIVVDHYKNELHLLEHRLSGAQTDSTMEEIERLLNNKNIPSYSFQRIGEEESNYTDEEFLKILTFSKLYFRAGLVRLSKGTNSMSIAHFAP